MLRTNKAGFSTVEALLASAIFGFLIVAIVGMLVYGSVSTFTSGNRARANFLAEEGIEAVRNIRDASYADLTVGTHGLSQSGGQWVLSGTSDTTDLYKREIIIQDIDAFRKEVTSRVTWQQTPQSTGTAEVKIRLTKWQAAISKTWSNAVFESSVDLSGSVDGVKVATAGNYFYFIRNDGSPDFGIFNLDTAGAPVVVGTLTLTGVPTNIAVSGNYAYVTTTSDIGELIIINISNPAAPSVTATFDMPGLADATGVFVSGSTVYVSKITDFLADEFFIVNASNPASPAIVGSYNSLDTLREIYVNGNVAYVASEADLAELTVINIATPSAPAAGTHLDIVGLTNATTIHGYGSNILLATDTGLHSINAATALAPTLRTSLTLSGTINDISSAGSFTFALVGTSAANAEFQVISLANLSSLYVSKTLDATGSASILGVAHNTSFDLGIAASISDTQEVQIYVPN